MPLTCINHLCRFLQSPRHGAASPPAREARCHMFRLRWIKPGVGGGSAPRRAAGSGLGAGSPESGVCCLFSSRRGAQGPAGDPAHRRPSCCRLPSTRLGAPLADASSKAPAAWGEQRWRTPGPVRPVRRPGNLLRDCWNERTGQLCPPVLFSSAAV